MHPNRAADPVPAKNVGVADNGIRDRRLPIAILLFFSPKENRMEMWTIGKKYSRM
jgi:hypothetical protein